MLFWYELLKIRRSIYIIWERNKRITRGFAAKIYKNTIRIPMREHLRSLNLSNSVAIVAYEVLRQNGFERLEQESKYFE